MQETGIHPPRTLMEVFRMLPEGTLAELIDNRLFMSPRPIGKHQRVLAELTLAFTEFAKKQNAGMVFFCSI